MQLSEANRLRKLWGDKPCDHTHLEKEYSLGASTGDMACTTCGRGFSEQMLDKLYEDRQKAKKSPDTT